MAVNHGRGIARLRGGRVLVLVQGEVIGAKAVAQAVVAVGDFEGLPQIFENPR